MKQIKIIAAFIFVFLTALSPAHLLGENFEGRKIRKISVVSPPDFDSSELHLELSPLRGQIFSSKKIDSILKRLYLSKRFHNISVHVSPDVKGDIEVSFVVELSRKIDSIEFKGNRFFSDVVLLRSMTSKEAGFFSEQLLVDDKKVLLSLYEESGYFQTDIQIRFSASQKPHLVQVIFEIK